MPSGDSWHGFELCLGVVRVGLCVVDEKSAFHFVACELRVECAILPDSVERVELGLRGLHVGKCPALTVLALVRSRGSYCD